MTRSILLIVALVLSSAPAAEAGPAARLAKNLGVSRAEARRIIKHRIIVGSAGPTGVGNTPANLGNPLIPAGTIGGGIGGVGLGQ
jgi:hypothetical protein